jgi:hypothetical protein
MTASLAVTFGPCRRSMILSPRLSSSAARGTWMCPAAFAASSEETPRPSLHLLGLGAQAVVAEPDRLFHTKGRGPMPSELLLPRSELQQFSTHRVSEKSGQP